MKQIHTEDPQMLSPTVKNLFDTVTWRPGFVHP